MESESKAERTLHGLPQTPHSGLTPLGEIEQMGKIADGLRYPRTGWRKWVVRVGLVLIGVAAVVTLIAWIVNP